MPNERDNSSWENFRPILRELRVAEIVRLLGPLDSITAEPELHIENNGKGRVIINQPAEHTPDLIIVRLNNLVEIHLKRVKEFWGETFHMSDEVKQRLKENYPVFFYVAIPDLPGCLCYGLTVEDGVGRILEQMERWIVGTYTPFALDSPWWRVSEKFKIIERNIVINF